MTGSTPLVTIGITAYNAADTVARAIASARAQDWPNTEIVVVDDCSTDDTWAVLTEEAASLDTVRALRQDSNGGVAVARNRILAEARGDFVVFFDDDDESTPDRVSRQVARITEYEARFADGVPVICHTATRRTYPDGTTLIAPTMGQRTGVKAPSGMPVARRILLGEEVEDAYGTLAACSQMARRSAYRDVGGFDGSLRRHEDSDIAVRFALQGAHFIGIADTLVHQKMTPTADKSLAKEHLYLRAMFAKHQNFIDTHGSYAFVRGWIDLKARWQQRGTLGTVLPALWLFLQFPRQTMFRIRMALPRCHLNQANRAFRKLVPERH
jgi:glycosyltransferase involved in cell wall biosynthesis